MLVLAFPTIKRFDLLARAVESARCGTRVPSVVAIIDNSNGGCPVIPGTWVHRTANLGVAASWNMFMNTFPNDQIIISNDDVIFDTYTISRLMEAVDHFPEYALFCPDAENVFSMFHLRRWAYEQLGPFDYNLFPAYFEDNDYARRIKLADLRTYKVTGSTYKHEGSATLQSYTTTEMEIHHQSFRKNREYYHAKWGGGPEQERFQTPFNQ